MAEREQEIEVTVERVLYPAETVENANWFILSIKEGGACKGSMGWRPRSGERLRLTGKYSSYQGKREFKFTQAALNIPTDSRGMLHYVCETATGVGAAIEAQLWERFGERWSEVREGEIPRLSGRIYDNFMESIERCEGDREKGRAIAELLAAGCSMNMATAAYEKWEAETIGVVSSDPYRLAELPNYGFQHVDGAIRQHFGIADDDPKRIRAAVIYVLRQITGGGSTLVAWDELNRSCLAKLGGFQNLITRCVSEMFDDGTLRGFPQSRAVALASDYNNEASIWQFIADGVKGVAA